MPDHVDENLAPQLAPLHGAVLSMGLKRLEAHDWLRREGINLAAYQANKKRCTTELGERALAVEPRSERAVAELVELIAHTIGTPIERPSSVQNQLFQASLAVAEDLCLLIPDDCGDYVLAAAHLCAPSHWKLEDKIGKAMDPVHVPVPGYDKKLARSVNLFMQNLSTERLVERYNWSLDEQPLLCQRPGAGTPGHQRVLGWYRTERQVLRRLPESGAIVFSILVQHWPLSALGRSPEAKATLLAAIEALPPALRAYKNLDHAPVLNWGEAH